MVRPIESELPNPPPKNLDYSISCEYYSGTPGHDMEKCWHLKNAIQELININRIKVQTPEAPNINQNPVPTHQETNMIEIVHKGGELKKPSHIVIMIRSSKVKPVKKPVIEGSVNKLSGANSEPSAVVKKGSPSDVAAKQEKSKVVVSGVANKPIIIVEGALTYKGKEVKEEVNETHGLTRLGRCFVSEELKKAKTSRDNPVLVKKAVTEEEVEEFLRKMKVQDYSIMEQLRKMPAQISLLSLLIHSDEHHRVTFSDDEFPMEGTEHNKALYHTVKYEDSVVTRVLVDNGSSVNICPLSTLNKLKVDDERIHKSSIYVRGFDGGGKDSIGDIVLELIIGPVEFTMEFQLLDVDVSYNLLLGRPWIHAAKAILSTLHQMVKFEWDRQ
ncbi:uncharacterized protein [Nicotiana sylvestris]|uniref:uncharacterized protein n=1 Tax=Nicotiana sylvestris TaxID=4096 RepID=UPI00388C9068